MKLIRWLDKNILLSAILILLAFIPLYPKLPIIGIQRTWVYIRLDDFLIGFAVILYFFELYRKKATWRTPLTAAIVMFWLAGLLSTVSGVLFIFPKLHGVFPHIALLYYLRHIEYLSVFFIAYSAVKEKKHIFLVIVFLLLTFGSVLLYGLGQRFIPCSFPAFSTMNEEFAKGLPLCLNASDRLQATFAGHYDFAAYLVMMIPIVGSLVFGFKKWWMKILMVLLSLLGVIELLMTASRTSFAMYLCAIIVMLLLQKQKKWIIPVLIVSGGLLFSFQGLYTRYAQTVAYHPIVYDSNGKFVGFATTDKDNNIIVDKPSAPGPDLLPGTVTVGSGKTTTSTTSVTVKETNASTSASTTKELKGNFVIKEQQTLDISASTRFQVEWPNAIKAFLRNPILGSGYSAITLATDGNYFRILGETGLLGLISFLGIFFLYGRILAKTLPTIASPLTRSLLLGIGAGIVGLMLNAILIDIFEASKIAYLMWIYIGLSLSILKRS